MFKVKSCPDSKQKALHRQRRYETAHKKYSRAMRYEKGEYNYWGYYVIRQKERVITGWLTTPTGNKIPITHIEKVGGKIFMVKRVSRNAKYLKKTASRKWRKQRIEEESFADRGGIYKKDYDIPWTLF